MTVIKLSTISPKLNLIRYYISRSGFFMTHICPPYPSESVIPVDIEFVAYIDSFYGTNYPIYPMMHQETKQPLNTYDIVRAIHTYIERIEKGDLEYAHYSWGDGDSLDRERVRDILLEEYNYKYVPETDLTGNINIADMSWVKQYA